MKINFDFGSIIFISMLLFVGLKLGHMVVWPWYDIFWCIALPFVMFAGFLSIAFLFFVLLAVLEAIIRR